MLKFSPALEAAIAAFITDQTGSSVPLEAIENSIRQNVAEMLGKGRAEEVIIASLELLLPAQPVLNAVNGAGGSKTAAATTDADCAAGTSVPGAASEATPPKTDEPVTAPAKAWWQEWKAPDTHPGWRE